MPENNKAMSEAANTAIAEGNYEGFLAYCADDTEWTFVGEQTLKGKEAVRQWMAMEYVEPPTNTVAHLIAEGDFVVAVGDITVKDKDGKAIDSFRVLRRLALSRRQDHRIKGVRHHKRLKPGGERGWTTGPSSMLMAASGSERSTFDRGRKQ
ncbi:MAG: nuclear transport factor 2 family protein [Chloroflexi bacterium AL-W]|nr:nuclear transport factor 2 family protein [Chloroflexi bacterium AL-N1]NOK66431.1 nuclear transport factor 2 family protein [Chloroflexi bacterium AL-N10]NOK71819.1 nuclear transport factor 2 family protein [Chloroflexi bacterium AL-N5]NOK81076.1 nuclear transport factor 2 family protein [Chloroflexi bacterium AL-W]NOK89349.1 nuclear transport factor 2 family protein [Chloroflexi bacterium AL-N15]